MSIYPTMVLLVSNQLHMFHSCIKLCKDLWSHLCPSISYNQTNKECQLLCIATCGEESCPYIYHSLIILEHTSKYASTSSCNSEASEVNSTRSRTSLHNYFGMYSISRMIVIKWPRDSSVAKYMLQNIWGQIIILLVLHGMLRHVCSIQLRLLTTTVYKYWCLFLVHARSTSQQHHMSIMEFLIDTVLQYH